MNVNWLVLPTLAVALILFAVGEKLVSDSLFPKRKTVIFVAALLAGMPGILFALFYLHWFDRVTCFYEFHSLPFVELFAAGVGILVGAVSALVRQRKLFTRPFLIVVLCLGITLPYLKPIIAPLSQANLRDRWTDDVCMQSTASSCGAASAATIFRWYRMNLTERDLTRECFTYQGGTENWYLARAFRRRGFNVQYVIRDGFPPDLSLPAIAGVKVGGAGHFIPILCKVETIYTTGDPLIGRRSHTETAIGKDYEFTGFFMVISKK